MSSRRIAKVAEALRECVSTTILFALKDPRVKNVTVLRTEVSPDLKSARVYVSVMGDEKTQSLAMHGLRSARGYIQSQIADRLELQYTPILSFVLDPGVKLSVATSAVIREALRSSTPGEAETDTISTAAEDATENATADAAQPADESGGIADSRADEAHETV